MPDIECFDFVRSKLDFKLGFCNPWEYRIHEPQKFSKSYKSIADAIRFGFLEIIKINLTGFISLFKKLARLFFEFFMLRKITAMFVFPSLVNMQ